MYNCSPTCMVLPLHHIRKAHWTTQGIQGVCRHYSSVWTKTPWLRALQKQGGRLHLPNIAARPLIVSGIFLKPLLCGHDQPATLVRKRCSSSRSTSTPFLSGMRRLAVFWRYARCQPHHTAQQPPYSRLGPADSPHIASGFADRIRCKQPGKAVISASCHPDSRGLPLTSSLTCCRACSSGCPSSPPPTQRRQ
jgi:hypothetical protein